MPGGPPFALITGCSSGIGKQLAIAFAEKGVTVLATARQVESLLDLTSEYENIEAFALELGSLASIDALRDVIVKRTGGRIDYLVNNAGTHYAATAMDLDVEEATKLFAVNVFAVMRLCQLFVPLLRQAPHGRIVQIGSVTRAVPVVWQSAYNASKAALSQYTKTLRLVSLASPLLPGLARAVFLIYHCRNWNHLALKSSRLLRPLSAATSSTMAYTRRTIRYIFQSRAR